MRDDVAMSDADEPGGASPGSGNDRGVIANLPRTRPQRASPRRAAAREATPPRRARSTRASSGSANGPATAATTKTPKPAAQPRKRASTTARAPRKRAAQAAPRQGFQSEAEAARTSIQPPGGGELLTAAVELVGELAKAGLSRGERALKDVAGRFPLP
jgi:hypothetical protein